MNAELIRAQLVSRPSCATPGVFSHRRIPGGNKGALRITSLSFQYLRRPSRAAKLLGFQQNSHFDPHRPYQLIFLLSLALQERFLDSGKHAHRPRKNLARGREAYDLYSFVDKGGRGKAVFVEPGAL